MRSSGRSSKREEWSVEKVLALTSIDYNGNLNTYYIIDVSEVRDQHDDGAGRVA